ncbi:MAG: winged helix-turn-helix domain-containing protein [Thaumarchaeota archaeon]|nr:winged helix-turn-helix domain-containing protein [Nitrososphaerota archaeon]
MSTLLEKPVKINRIVTTSIGHARAIEDPARAKVIEILYQKALSAEQITKELAKFGHKKALTTVRHHLEILKASGLVEIAKIEESRGAITKFYSTSIKLLSYDVPDDFQDKYSKIIANTSAKVEKILQKLDPKISQPGNSKSKTKDTPPAGYSQYLVMEIMNRAITNVLEDPQYGKT